MFSYTAKETVFCVTEAFSQSIPYSLIANLYVVEYLRRMWYYTYIDVNKDHLLTEDEGAGANRRSGIDYWEAAEVKRCIAVAGIVKK